VGWVIVYLLGSLKEDVYVPILMHLYRKKCFTYMYSAYYRRE
jgi:hypothetical protein